MGMDGWGEKTMKPGDMLATESGKKNRNVEGNMKGLLCFQFNRIKEDFSLHTHFIVPLVQDFI